MSSIAQEWDNATLTGMVREGMQQAQNQGEACDTTNRQSWEKRLASRTAQLATGSQGASLQQVMDDLRD